MGGEVNCHYWPKSLAFPRLLALQFNPDLSFVVFHHVAPHRRIRCLLHWPLCWQPNSGLCLLSALVVSWPVIRTFCHHIVHFQVGWSRLTVVLPCQIFLRIDLDIVLALDWRASLCICMLGFSQPVPTSFDPWVLLSGQVHLRSRLIASSTYQFIQYPKL
jgi:hypothetical protein